MDAKKAVQTIGQAQTSNRIGKKAFYRALFLAGTIFRNRLAQNRQLVIVSCGNCVDYDMMAALKLNKILKARNVVVSAYGNYEMTDLDESLGDEKAIGYGYQKIFLGKDSGEVEVDSLEGYKVEHNMDLCSRLAVKTGGAVFDVNQLKNAKVFETTIAQLREVRPKFENKVSKCERISTPFGDMADFSYKRTRVSGDADDDEDDDNDEDN